MFRGFRYSLQPTPEQESKLRHFAGVCRLVYNAALEQRTTYWRQYLAATGKHISFAGQSKELTQLRAEVDWIAEVPRTALEYALRDLDAAFQAFFKGAGYPTPRRKGVSDKFRMQARDMPVRRLNGKWSAVRVPNVGWVKFRDTRPLTGCPISISFGLGADGWAVAFSCDQGDAVAAPVAPMARVGVDRGVVNTVTLSTGERLSVPSALAAIEKRQRRALRSLNRKRRGSARYSRQRQRVARLAARSARIRRDWHHRVTTDLARKFGAVVIEDLNTAGLTARGAGKRGLNRSILNQGWFVFETLLAYKLEERGGTLVKVPAAYTSQTCSECGAIDRESRESQASFHCRHCGFEAHADVNAAINICRGSTSALRVEAPGYGAVETRTGNGRELVENHLALAR